MKTNDIACAGVILGSFLSASCYRPEVPGEPSDWACYELAPSSDEAVGVAVEELSVFRGLLWPEWRRPIQVCWEGAGWEGEGFEEYRRIVREAVTEQWETTFASLEDGTPVPEEKRVRFEGWTRCRDGFNGGIRIRVADERPHALLGTFIAGLPWGMVLNFTFNNWSTGCASDAVRASCIRAIAVHEFGHALGFGHEQDRADTPRSCEDERYPPGGDFYGGTWDLSSVMNYCNPLWNNGGELSEQDRRWARVVYYPEYYPEVSCRRIGERSDSSRFSYEGARP